MTRTPVGGLTPRAWKRLERDARAAHEQETLAAARLLDGALHLTVAPSRLGALLLRGSERQAVLAGVAAAAPLNGLRCSLDAAGRYGRCWWLRLRVGGRSVTVAGSYLRVEPVGGGTPPGESLDSPAGGEEILVPCEYGSPSATSPE